MRGRDGDLAKKYRSTFPAAEPPSGRICFSHLYSLVWLTRHYNNDDNNNDNNNNDNNNYYYYYYYYYIHFYSALSSYELKGASHRLEKRASWNNIET